MWNPKKLWSASAVSVAALLGMYLAGAVGGIAAKGADIDQRLPDPLVDETPKNSGTETLVLAGGCFWGVQGVFQHVRGVVDAVSGYDGGTAGTAQYQIVSTGTTGHAESVRITYDPHVITYGRLLQIFFSVTTDPTQLNQQYPDEGTQYRSEIFAGTSRAGPDSQGIYYPARQGQSVPESDRHKSWAGYRFLSGRGLSPELPDPASREPLHRDVRSSEDRGRAEGFPH